MMDDSWFGKRSESELRRNRAETFYEFEMDCRRQALGDPASAYDEEKELFRFTAWREMTGSSVIRATISLEERRVTITTS